MKCRRPADTGHRIRAGITYYIHHRSIDVNERGYVLTRDTPYGMTTRKACLPEAMSPTDPLRYSRDAGRQKRRRRIARYIDAVKLMETIE